MSKAVRCPGDAQLRSRKKSPETKLLRWPQAVIGVARSVVIAMVVVGLVGEVVVVVVVALVLMSLIGVSVMPWTSPNWS
jgi:hypothetical protein